MANKREELMARLKNNLAFASKAISMQPSGADKSASSDTSFISAPDSSRRLNTFDSANSNNAGSSHDPMFVQTSSENSGPSQRTTSLNDESRPPLRADTQYLDYNLRETNSNDLTNSVGTTNSELRLSEPFMQSVMALLGQQNLSSPSNNQPMEQRGGRDADLAIPMAVRSIRTDSNIENGQNVVVSTANSPQLNSRSRIKFIGPSSTSVPQSRMPQEVARSLNEFSATSQHIVGMQSTASPIRENVNLINSSSAMSSQGTRDFCTSSAMSGQNMSDLRLSSAMYGQNMSDLRVSSGMSLQNTSDLRISSGISGQNMNDLHASSAMSSQNMSDLRSSSAMSGQNVSDFGTSSTMSGQIMSNLGTNSGHGMSDFRTSIAMSGLSTSDLRFSSVTPGITNDHRNTNPAVEISSLNERPQQFGSDSRLPPLATTLFPSGSRIPMSTAEREKLVGAMEEMHSNVTVLEEALTNLLQMKELMLGRPPGPQRDTLILENMRMQEEINDQLWALNQAAKEISDKLLKDIELVAAMHQQQQQPQQQRPQLHYEQKSTNQQLHYTSPSNVPSIQQDPLPLQGTQATPVSMTDSLTAYNDPQRQLFQDVQNRESVQMQIEAEQSHGLQPCPPAHELLPGPPALLASPLVHNPATHPSQPVLQYTHGQAVLPPSDAKAQLQEPGLKLVKSAYESSGRSSSETGSTSSYEKRLKIRARSHSNDKTKSYRHKGRSSDGRSHNRSRHKSRSRDRRGSHSRSDRKRFRSRSRSGGRRHSGSRYKSREKYRSRSRDRRGYKMHPKNNVHRLTATLSPKSRRSAEVKRSTSQQKVDTEKLASEQKVDAEKAARDAKAEEERLAIEKEISTYMKAESYYDAGTEWCKKCNCLLTGVGDLCRHLHSDAHQRQIDPDYDATRSVEAPPLTDTTLAIAPARGGEFLLPLAAFFCSVCCEFTKDRLQAEEHIRSQEHNNNFKKFLSENPSYEIEFQKERNVVIQEAKEKKQKAEEDAAKVNKFQLKFMNPSKQPLIKTSFNQNGNSPPASVESKPVVVSLGKITLPLGSPTTATPTINIFSTTVASKSTESNAITTVSSSTVVSSSSFAGSKLVKSSNISDFQPVRQTYKPRVTGWQLSAVTAQQQRRPAFPALSAKGNQLRPARPPALGSVKQHQTPAFKINAVSASSAKLQSSSASTTVASGKGAAGASASATGAVSSASAGGKGGLKTPVETTANTATTGADNSTVTSSKDNESLNDEKMEDMDISDFVIFDEC